METALLETHPSPIGEGAMEVIMKIRMRVEEL
jgi:hypothetical protein